MKRGTPDHPKTADLCARLRIRRWEAVGILESLWHFTAQFTPQGDIGKYTDEAIAKALDWNRDPRRLVEALCESKWVDVCPVNRLVVHDWEDHSDQTVKRVLAKRGLAFIKSHASTALAPSQSDARSQVRSALPETSQPLPLPLPLPQPPPQPDAQPPLPPVVISDWQETHRAITEVDACVDPPYVMQIIHATVQAAISAELDMSEVTDENIARVVRDIAVKKKPRSAALLMRLVPQQTVNWGRV